MRRHRTPGMTGSAQRAGRDRASSVEQRALHSGRRKVPRLDQLRRSPGDLLQLGKGRPPARSRTTLNRTSKHLGHRPCLLGGGPASRVQRNAQMLRKVLKPSLDAGTGPSSQLHRIPAGEGGQTRTRGPLVVQERGLDEAQRGDDPVRPLCHLPLDLPEGETRGSLGKLVRQAGRPRLLPGGVRLLTDLPVNSPRGLPVRASESESRYSHRDEAARLSTQLHIDDYEGRRTELGIHHLHRHHDIDPVWRCGARSHGTPLPGPRPGGRRAPRRPQARQPMCRYPPARGRTPSHSFRGSAEGPRKPLIECRTSPTTRTCGFKSDQAGGPCPNARTAFTFEAFARPGP